MAIIFALVVVAAGLLDHLHRRRVDARMREQDELLTLQSQALTEYRAHLTEHCQTVDWVIRTLQAQDEQIQALGREAAARERKRPWLS